jgi:hypothetical protein
LHAEPIEYLAADQLNPLSHCDTQLMKRQAMPVAFHQLRRNERTLAAKPFFRLESANGVARSVRGVWSAASVTRGADVARYRGALVCELSRTVGREPIVSARPISSVAAALSAAAIPALAEGA